MEDQETILKRIRDLALSPANDAVKLTFFTGEDLGRLEGLDLASVTEFKRNKDGGVEIKFVDRLAALQWLAEKSRDSAAEELRQAIAQGGEKVWGQES